MEEKQADGVSIILMNPSNGELYAMVNVPEFDLDDPFTLPQGTVGLTEEETTGCAQSDVEESQYQ